MPVITDLEGLREVNAEELERMNAEAEERWNAFWSGLTWRPIAEYNASAGRPELLRAGDRWAIGYFGPGVPMFRAEDDDAVEDDTTVLDAAWRNAQDSVEGVPLDFSPTEFAALTDEWRYALMED